MKKKVKRLRLREHVLAGFKYVELPAHLGTDPYSVPQLDPVLVNKCVVFGPKMLLPKRLVRLLPAGLLDKRRTKPPQGCVGKSESVKRVCKCGGIAHVDLRLGDIHS